MRINFKPNQLAMVNWLASKDEACLFADMGEGKTLSTLAAIDRVKPRGVLIVAPLRVAVLTWPHEVEKFFPHLTVYNLRTKAGQEAWRLGVGDIYTINYEMLPKFCREVLNREDPDTIPVDTIVFDELSAAKNNGKRIKAIKEKRYLFKRFWGLTGTPTPNGMTNLFYQVNIIDGGKRFGKYYTHFLKAYFEVVNPYSDWPKYEVRPQCKGMIEAKISDLCLVIKGNGKNRPTFVDHEIALDAESRKAYKKLEQELILSIKDRDIEATNQGGLAKKLVQMTSGAIYETRDDGQPPEVIHLHDQKIKALRELTTEGNLLVFCQFKHEFSRIAKAFPEAVKFENDQLEPWNRGEIKLLYAHPKSIGHGLNLQFGGSTIVWFSLDWDQEIFDQANARLARPGQKNPVKIFRLVARDTFDVALVETLRNKGSRQNGFKTALQNLQELRKT